MFNYPESITQLEPKAASVEFVGISVVVELVYSVLPDLFTLLCTFKP